MFSLHPYQRNSRIGAHLSGKFFSRLFEFVPSSILFSLSISALQFSFSQGMFVHRSSRGKSTTIPSYPFPSSTPIFACRTKSALVSYIGQITAVIAPLAYELDHGEYLLLLSHSPASVQSLHPLQ